MLYVGIAPKKPYADGRPSRTTIQQRVRYHYAGNAEGSTLRLTLGCLLADELGIELRRVGSGTRRTFSDGERKLSEWMGSNAFVCWTEDPEPWLLEEDLIAQFDLPLNLDQNKRNTFHPAALSRSVGGEAASGRASRVAKVVLGSSRSCATLSDDDHAAPVGAGKRALSAADAMTLALAATSFRSGGAIARTIASVSEPARRMQPLRRRSVRGDPDSTVTKAAIAFAQQRSS